MKAVWVAFVILAVPAASASGAVEIHVDDSDKVPVIEGRIGEDASFSGKVRLTAKAAISNLVFLASDLKLDGGSAIISRDQVTLATGDKVELQQNVPKDVKFKVAGVKIPGTYRGAIEFWQPDPGVLRLPLTVVAIAPPKLTPRKGTNDIKLQLVNCRSYDCWIARILLPAGLVIDEYPLTFDNDSLAPVQMRATNVAAVGEQDRYPLTYKELELPSQVTFAVQPMATLLLKIHRADIPADHYVGDIQLMLADQEARIKLPLDLNVRTGPGIAVLVLLLGIGLGRLVKYMKEKGGPQSDLLWSVHQLEARVAAEAVPADQQVLRPMLDRVRNQVYQMELDAAKAELANIRNRLESFKRLREIDNLLAGKDPNHPQIRQVQQMIAEARQRLANRQDAQAAEVMARIEAQLQATAQAMMGPAGPDEGMMRAAQHAGAARQLVAQGVQVPAPLGFPRLRNFLASLTGVSQELIAEATLWLARPILYVVLILALLLVGLEQLYSKNPIFGANPLMDYAGLVFWAMSSDVASRTLSNIRG